MKGPHEYETCLLLVTDKSEAQINKRGTPANLQRENMFRRYPDEPKIAPVTQTTIDTLRVLGKYQGLSSDPEASPRDSPFPVPVLQSQTFRRSLDQTKRTFSDAHLKALYLLLRIPDLASQIGYPFPIPEEHPKAIRPGSLLDPKRGRRSSLSPWPPEGGIETPASLSERRRGSTLSLSNSEGLGYQRRLSANLGGFPTISPQRRTSRAMSMLPEVTEN